MSDQGLVQHHPDGNPGMLGMHHGSYHEIQSPSIDDHGHYPSEIQAAMDVQSPPEVKPEVTLEEHQQHNPEDQDQSANPWQGDTLLTFCFFCCPECDFRSHSEEPFQSHAIECHPQSQPFFDHLEVMSKSKSKKKAKVKKQSKSRRQQYYYDDYSYAQEEEEDPEWYPGQYFPGEEAVPDDSKAGLQSLNAEPMDQHDPAMSTTVKSDPEVKPYACDQCDERYSKLYALAMHKHWIHKSGKRGKFNCPACKFHAISMIKIKEHIVNVHESPDEPFIAPTPASVKKDKVIPCEYEGCNYKCSDTVYLKQHILRIHNRDQHKHKCEECNKTFANKTLLQIHVDGVHLKLQKYVCEKCGKGFRVKAYYTTHIEQPSCDFLTSRDKIYKCESCSDEFPMLKNYIGHHRKVHGSFPTNIQMDKPLFMCDECPDAYFSESALKGHKRRKHSGKQMQYQKAPKVECPHCHKMFRRGRNYVEHIKSKHEMDTPFKCDQCTKSYGTEAYLRLHVMNVHRRLTCNICGKDICNKLWFKRHMAKVHGVMPANSFPCEQCTLVFDTEDAKMKHAMKQHAPQGAY